MIELRWFSEYMTMNKKRERELPGTPYDYGYYFAPVLQFRNDGGEWINVERVKEDAP